MGMKPVEGSIAAASAVFQCDAEGRGFRMEKRKPFKEKQNLQIPSHLIKGGLFGVTGRLFRLM